MNEPFLRLFIFWLVLCLVQSVAALPWLGALDRRTILALRRLKPLGMVLGGNVLAALVAVFAIANNPDVLMHWGRGYMAALHLQLAADFFVIAFVVLLQFWPKGGAVALAA